MSSGNYYPLPEEYLLTGLFGTALYICLCIMCVQSLFRSRSSRDRDKRDRERDSGGSTSSRSSSTRRFFMATCCMSVLELPRFVLLCWHRSYTSRVAYSLHIAAGVFFFLAFSIVCRQWAGLLTLGTTSSSASSRARKYALYGVDANTAAEAGPSVFNTVMLFYFKLIYSVKSLIVSNSIFAGIDVIAIIACCSSHSLQSYFFSTSFEAITFIEGFRNVIYALFLTYFGIKLVKRFWHFSTVEKHTLAKRSGIMSIINNRRNGKKPPTHSDSIDGKSTQLVEFSRFDDDVDDAISTSSGGNSASTAVGGSWLASFKFSAPQNQEVFTKVVYRLACVLVLVSLCFLFRLAMLLTKMIVLNNEDSKLTSKEFPLFGFLWFTCSDFIPRALPCFALILLMRAKKPSKDSIMKNRRQGGDSEGNEPMNGYDYAKQPYMPSGGGQSSSATAFQFVRVAQDESTFGGIINEHSLYSKAEHLIPAGQYNDDENEDMEIPLHPHDQPEHISFSALHSSFQDNLSDYSDDDLDDDDNIGEAAMDKLFSLISQRS